MNNDIIIQDEVFFDIIEKDNKIKYISTARNALYYQTMMDRADLDDDGKESRKAAAQFYAMQRIYCYLANLGYLTSEFCEDIVPSYGGLKFTLNLTKLIEKNPHLKKSLYKDLKDDSHYVNLLFQPPKKQRCKICGNYFLSVSKSMFTDKQIDFCSICKTLSDGELKSLVVTRRALGVEAATLAKTRMAQAKRCLVSDNCKLIDLVKDFEKEYSVNMNSFEMNTIKKILNYDSNNDYDVIDTTEFGIVIFNLNQLNDIKIFSKSFILNSDGTEIQKVLNYPGATYTGKFALKFVQSLTTNPLEKDFLDDLLHPF
jgi:hypothetical protein